MSTVPPEFVQRRVVLPLRLGELTLGRLAYEVLVRNEPLSGPLQQRRWSTADVVQPEGDAVAGYQIKGAWIPDQLTGLERQGRWIRYVYSVYPRYFLDFGAGIDEYKSKFSGKSLYNLRRQRRIYFETVKSGGDIVTARTVDEVKDFFQRARKVSRGTYQERLLQAGLPEHDDFQRRMLAAAAAGNVRGYLLPGADGCDAAYMYCLVEGDDIVCKYIGYDPTLAKYSPGSTLLLMAIESLFAERGSGHFDFEEGGAQYKKQFSTGFAPCGNVLLLRANPARVMGLAAHRACVHASSALSRALDRFGLKAALRRLIRRRATTAAAP